MDLTLLHLEALYASQRLEAVSLTKSLILLLRLVKRQAVVDSVTISAVS